MVYNIKLFLGALVVWILFIPTLLLICGVWIAEWIKRRDYMPNLFDSFCEEVDSLTDNI